MLFAHFLQHILKYFLYLICFMVATFASAQPITPPSIYVVSFNVLAPCWASPRYYPAGVAPYLNPAQRRNRILSFLEKISTKADIIALQETTQAEFNSFKELLQDDFYAFQTYHDPQYWSDWISPDIPWTPNGVAIFVKKTSFTNVTFLDLPLSGDGNHCAYFEGTQQSTGRMIRAASIHFDSELDLNRYLELNALLKFMAPSAAKQDIIAGDFNFGTERGAIHRALESNHFVDVLHRLQREEWTSPFDMEGDRNSGILDHIAVRNSKPIDGQVINFGLWKLYPHDETARIIANLQISGSDHFPLFGVLSEPLLSES